MDDGTGGEKSPQPFLPAGMMSPDPGLLLFKGLRGSSSSPGCDHWCSPRRLMSAKRAWQNTVITHYDTVKDT